LALAAKLRRPLAAAASFDVALEEEHFCAEEVAEVVITEEEVRAPAPVDDIEAAEIGANAHSVQPDIAARIVTKPVPETTAFLVDIVLPSTINNPVHLSPPPSSRVFEPDKLTSCETSGPFLISLQACSLTFWLQKI
jgi:hypothetical protein